MIRAWTPPTEQEQLAALFRLGYFESGWDEVKTLLLTSPVVTDARDKYIELHGINGDDFADHTLRPRCGCPDFARGPMEAGQAKWNMLDVSTSHRLSGLNPLSAEREHAAWLEAIAAWNAVCGIRLAYIDDMPRANIYANPGSTGAGVLAWSYLPNNSGPSDRLQQQYNRSTNWSYSLLVNVVIHEIGHAIGLDHGPRGSIMQPTAGGDITRPMAWDITEAVSRYGAAAPAPPPPPPQGFALTIKRRLDPGNYRVEPTETDHDIEVRSPIGKGRARLVNPFDMG